MRHLLGSTLVAITLAAYQSAAASESRSLDDNPWRYLNIDVPPSWSMARWQGERVNHVLDILSALGDCECKKAVAILEKDLREYQSALENEMEKIKAAESKGNASSVPTDAAREKQDRLAASEARARAERYWSAHPAKSEASQGDKNTEESN